MGVETAAPTAPPTRSRGRGPRRVLRRAAWTGLDVLVAVLALGVLLGSLGPSWLRAAPGAWLPHWLHYVEIEYWLDRVTLPGWAQTVADHKAYGVAVVVAVIVALSGRPRRSPERYGRGSRRPRRG